MSLTGRLFAALALTSGVASVALAEAPLVSFGTYGSVGIVDTPSAFMQPDGQTSWSFVGSGTMNGGVLNFQLLPYIEASVRSVSLNDWTAPGDSFGDTTLDLKFRLAREGNIRPEISVGFRDFGSNGPTSAEYLVASKHFGENIEVSAGIGWGRLGSYNPIGAPFGARAPMIGDGVSFDHLFAGDAALFGGVLWRTPINGLSLKAEYSSDAYTGEQVHGDFTHNSPFNFGVDYQLGRHVLLGAYYNYGSDFGFNITLTGNPNEPITPQDLGVGPAPVNARPADYSRDVSWAATTRIRTRMIEVLSDALAQEGITVHEGRITGDTLELYITNNRYSRLPMAIGRLVRVLAGSTPPSVEVFRITSVSGNLPTTTMEIRRSDLEAQVDRPNAGPQSFATTGFSDAAAHIDGNGVWVRDVYPKFTWSFAPQIPINLFSAESFGELDVLIRGSARYQFSQAFGVNLSVSQKILGNIGEGAGPSLSVLPHVRSDASLYNSAGPVIGRLTADYMFKVSPAVYGRVSVGYLERMFGGIDAELLWKPANQQWGLGLDVAYVKQRAFDSMFGFQGYETMTGHASLYWNTGFRDLEAQIDVGRYLAGDWGATFSLSRRFTNGWEVAAYMTVTDVSHADFGSGNFDKGVSLTIPFDWTLPFESSSSTSISLAGYGNDGGARLNIANRLYPVVRGNSVIELNESWGAYWQ